MNLSLTQQNKGDMGGYQEYQEPVTRRVVFGRMTLFLQLWWSWELGVLLAPVKAGGEC